MAWAATGLDFPPSSETPGFAFATAASQDGSIIVGQARRVESASFTGTGSGTLLTVTGVAGVITFGDALLGNGVPDGTHLISQFSGTPGGNGVYLTDNATTCSGDTLLLWPASPAPGSSAASWLKSDSSVTMLPCPSGLLADIAYGCSDDGSFIVGSSHNIGPANDFATTWTSGTPATLESNPATSNYRLLLAGGAGYDPTTVGFESGVSAGFPSTFNTGLFSWWVLGNKQNVELFGAAPFGDVSPTLRLIHVVFNWSGTPSVTVELISSAEQAFTYDIPTYIVNATTDGMLLHLAVAFDMAANTIQVYLQREPLTPTSTGWTTTDPMNGAGYLNLNATGTKFVGDLWFGNTASLFDLSVTSNLNKLIDINCQPVDLGANGENVTGSSPPVFLHCNSSAADFPANFGTSGSWGLFMAPSGSPGAEFGAFLGATFTGTGSGTNLTVTGVIGIITAETIDGDVISGAGVPGGTQVTSQTSGAANASFTGTGSGTNLTASAVTGVIVPGDLLGGTGVPPHTTTLTQTSGPSNATFTGTGSGTSLTTTGTVGVIATGDGVSGTGVPSGTVINSQFSGTPGGDGVYITNLPTTSSGASLFTFTPGGAGVYVTNNATTSSADALITFTPGSDGVYVTTNPTTSSAASLTASSVFLQVTVITSGTLAIGQVITGANIANAEIVAGAGGGTGRYQIVGPAQFVAGETMWALDAVSLTGKSVTYSSQALGCSGDGSVVVGFVAYGGAGRAAFQNTAGSGYPLPAVWVSGGDPTVLDGWAGTKPGYGYGEAIAVTQDGSIAVGFAADSSDPVAANVQPVFWTLSDGVLHTLTSLSGGSDWDFPLAVANSGTIVSGIERDDAGIFGTFSTPVLWTSGTPAMLPGLPGNTDDFLGQGAGISGDGARVVGYSDDAAGNSNAVYWQSGTINLLPYLNLTDTFASAEGISRDGATPVGQSKTPGSDRVAVYWQQPPLVSGGIGELYFATPATFFDLSIPANRAKFHDASGNPVSLGLDGTLPTGAAPVVFLSREGGAPDAFAINFGVGGAFTVTGGTLDDAGTITGS